MASVGEALSFVSRVNRGEQLSRREVSRLLRGIRDARVNNARLVRLLSSPRTAGQKLVVNRVTGAPFLEYHGDYTLLVVDVRVEKERLLSVDREEVLNAIENLYNSGYVFTRRELSSVRRTLNRSLGSFRVSVLFGARRFSFTLTTTENIDTVYDILNRSPTVVDGVLITRAEHVEFTRVQEDEIEEADERLTDLAAIGELWVEGHVFSEADLDTIHALVEEEATSSVVMVNLTMTNDRRITLPLSGAFSQLDSFLQILRDRFSEDQIHVVDESDRDEIVVPEDVVLVDAFPVNFLTDGAGYVGYFPYANTSRYDLSHYQIYPFHEEPEAPECCLLFALAKCGVEDAYIKHVAACLPGRGYHITMATLKLVAPLIRRRIVLHQWQGAGKRDKQRTKTIGPREFKDKVDLALLKGHLFVYEKTQCTRFALQHYEDVYTYADFHAIVLKVGTGVRRGKKDCVSSLELVTTLLDKQLLVKNTTTHHPENNFCTDLSPTLVDLEQQPFLLQKANLDTEQKLEDNRKKKPKLPTKHVFADLESSTEGEYHGPILAGWSYEDDDQVYVTTGTDCVDRMFTKIAKDLVDWTVVVWFHYAKYDVFSSLRHLVRSKLVHVLEKDNNLYSAIYKVAGKTIRVKDSFKILPFALSKFQEMFHLSQGKKDHIPYSYFTEETLDTPWVRWDQAEVNEHLVPPYKATDERQEFWQFVRDNSGPTSYQITETHVNLLEFYKWYLRYDVEILKSGLLLFREQIKQFTADFLEGESLDILDFLTIPSFADRVFSLKGCYEGVYEMNGNLRNFCQQSVSGGRAVVNRDFVKAPIVGHDVTDFDATSLYPSAIERLCEELGFPLGACKMIEDVKAPLDRYDHYVVKILVKDITRYQQLPVVCCKIKDKKVYFNRGDTVPVPVVIGRQGLEDWITFAGIDYEVLEGVYWNQGFNKKGAQTIRELFQLRLHYKAQGNDLQLVVKLLLNSIYGKNIVKKQKYRTMVAPLTKYQFLVKKYLPLIVKVETFGGHCLVKIAEYDSSYSRPQVGAAILEMSKRIMYEVCEVAQRLGVWLSYTDTDSLHLSREGLMQVVEEFQRVHARPLVGKNLGQFHCDFSLPCGHQEIYSDRTLHLAPKTYVDCLYCKICGARGEHCRAKGIPSKVLVQRDVWSTYNRLAQDETVEFVLNPEGTVRFQARFSGVKTLERGSFKRKLCFRDKCADSEEVEVICKKPCEEMDGYEKNPFHNLPPEAEPEEKDPPQEEDYNIPQLPPSEAKEREAVKDETLTYGNLTFGQNFVSVDDQKFHIEDSNTARIVAKTLARDIVDTKTGNPVCIPWEAEKGGPEANRKRDDICYKVRSLIRTNPKYKDKKLPMVGDRYMYDDRRKRVAFRKKEDQKPVKIDANDRVKDDHKLYSEKVQEVRQKEARDKEYRRQHEEDFRDASRAPGGARADHVEPLQTTSLQPAYDDNVINKWSRIFGIN